MSVQHFSIDDVTAWFKAKGKEVYLGDMLDETNSETMSVGFARYAPGAANEWTVTYDEALIVTKGRYSIVTDEGVWTAGQGEVLFLTKGTKLTYRAEEEETEVVYVSYPHWAKATRESVLAHQLEDFQPV